MSHLERLEQAQTVELDGEWMVFDAGNGRVAKLNNVGGFIWECLGKRIGIEELTDAVHQKYGVSTEAALSDALPFLEHMKQLGLIKEV